MILSRMRSPVWERVPSSSWTRAPTSFLPSHVSLTYVIFNMFASFLLFLSFFFLFSSTSTNRADSVRHAEKELHG